VTPRILSLAALAALFATSPVMAFDWSGFYAGVHGGYGTGTDDVVTTLLDENGNVYLVPGTDDPVILESTLDVTGPVGGLQIGVNHRIDSIVFGLEADYSVAAIAGSFQYDPSRDEAVAGGSIDHIATVRGRIGAALDSTLFYATAGLAYAYGSAYADNVWSPAPAEDVATAEGSSFGYVVGAGIEHAVNDSVSIRAEYLHYTLTGSVDMVSDAYPDGTVLRADTVFNVGTVRAGLNFHF